MYNDLQTIAHKTKYRVTRTPLKTGVNSKLQIEDEQTMQWPKEQEDKQ